MLVLSRKERQKVVIDGNIIVTVVSIRGDKVRLGFEARRHISVHREEIHQIIEAERRQEEANDGDRRQD